MPKIQKLNIFLVAIYVLIHIFMFIFLLWYQNNIKTYSRIAFYSKEDFDVVFSTPLNKSVILNKKSSDTITLPFRPVKKVFLSVSGNMFYISDSFSKKDDGFISSLNDKQKTIKYQTEIKSDIKLLSILRFLYQSSGRAGKFLLFLLYFIFFVFIVVFNRCFINKFIKRKTLQFYRWINEAFTLDEIREFKQFCLNKRQWLLMIIIFIMFSISIFSNLGKNDFLQTEHESLRAIVALEMKLSGNYIMPTKHGEPYLNKPPLYHWLLAPFSDKDNVEYNLRAISVLFLLFMAGILFLFVYKTSGIQLAGLTTVFFISANSVFGFKQLQIDQFFSFACLFIFFINFYYSNSKKFWHLFIISYILVSVGFLTKGFIVLWFQLISLSLALYISHAFRKIFSWQHIIGLLIFIMVAFFYFLLYSKYANPWVYIQQLLFENDSISGYTLIYRVKSFLLFPLINIFSYLPLLAFIPIIFSRKGLYIIHKFPMVKYSFYLVLIMLPVFWVSPSYAFYYILMLIPFMAILISANYQIIINSRIGIRILFCLPCLMIFYYQWFAGLIALITLSGFVFFKKYKTESFLIFLLINIIIMTFFIKDKDLKGEKYAIKDQTYRLAKKFPDSPIYLFNKNTKYQDAVLFYLTYHKKQIINDANNKTSFGNIYLANKEQVPKDFIILDSLNQKVYSQQMKNRIGKMNDVKLYLISK